MASFIGPSIARECVICDSTLSRSEHCGVSSAIVLDSIRIGFGSCLSFGCPVLDHTFSEFAANKEMASVTEMVFISEPQTLCLPRLKPDNEKTRERASEFKSRTVHPPSTAGLLPLRGNPRKRGSKPIP